VDDEEQLLKSVALQNAHSILLARQRAEAALLQAQEDLRRSEERLRAVFDQAAVGIAISGLDGQLIEVNEKAAEILGYSTHELTERTFVDLTHRDDVESTRRVMRQLLDRSVSAVSFEKRYVRKDGSEVWSWTTVTTLKDRHGEPRQFIGVVEDISARKRTESALVDESRMLELLNRTGEALGSTLDLQTLLQTATDAATALSGAQFGALFYNQTDAKGDAYQLYTLSGAPRAAFERFGALRPTAL